MTPDEMRASAAKSVDARHMVVEDGEAKAALNSTRLGSFMVIVVDRRTLIVNSGRALLSLGVLRGYPPLPE